MNSKNNDLETSENLEEKIGFFGRLKYIILPAAVTIGSYFTPEIKDKYEVLSFEKKEKYTNAAIIGTGIIGAALTAFSGYKLYKKYNEKHVLKEK